MHEIFVVQIQKNNWYCPWTGESIGILIQAWFQCVAKQLKYAYEPL